MRFWLLIDGKPVETTGTKIDQLRQQGSIPDNLQCISVDGGQSWMNYQQAMATAQPAVASQPLPSQVPPPPPSPAQPPMPPPPVAGGFDSGAAVPLAAEPQYVAAGAYEQEPPPVARDPGEKSTGHKVALGIWFVVDLIIFFVLLEAIGFPAIIVSIIIDLIGRGILGAIFSK